MSRISALVSAKVPPESLELIKPVCSHNDYSSFSGPFLPTGIHKDPNLKKYLETLIELFPTFPSSHQ
jgi:hypothetical protein